LLKNGAVSQADIDFLHLTDDPDEALELIRKVSQGLVLKLRPLQANVD